MLSYCNGFAFCTLTYLKFDIHAQGPAATVDENGRARRLRTDRPERLFSCQAPRRAVPGTPMDENRRARSETGPSGGWLFSKQRLARLYLPNNCRQPWLSKRHCAAEGAVVWRKL